MLKSKSWTHSVPDTERRHRRFLPTNRPACLYLRHPTGPLKCNNVSIVVLGSYSNSKKCDFKLPKTTLTRLSLAEPFIFWYSSFTGHLSMFLQERTKNLFWFCNRVLTTSSVFYFSVQPWGEHRHIRTSIRTGAYQVGWLWRKIQTRLFSCLYQKMHQDPEP